MSEKNNIKPKQIDDENRQSLQKRRISLKSNQNKSLQLQEEIVGIIAKKYSQTTPEPDPEPLLVVTRISNDSDDVQLRDKICAIELNCESFLEKKSINKSQNIPFPRIGSWEKREVIKKSSPNIKSHESIKTTAIPTTPTEVKSPGIKRYKDPNKFKFGIMKWKKKHAVEQPKRVVIILEESTLFHGTNIPEFVVFCTQTLQKNNFLLTKGIYRESPSFDEAQKLLQSASSPKEEDITSIDNPILLAGGMKGFFKAMEKSLLFSDKFNSFFNQDKMQVKQFDQEKIDISKDMVNALPTNIIEIFLYIVLHLNEVSSHKDENLMTISNLTRVWSPCLFSDNFIDNLDLLNLLSNQSNTLLGIVENYQQIFTKEVRMKIEHFYDPTMKSIPRKKSIELVIPPEIIEQPQLRKISFMDTIFEKMKRYSNNSNTYKQISSIENDYEEIEDFDDDDDRNMIISRNVEINEIIEQQTSTDPNIIEVIPQKNRFRRCCHFL